MSKQALICKQYFNRGVIIGKSVIITIAVVGLNLTFIVGGEEAIALFITIAVIVIHMSSESKNISHDRPTLTFNGF